MNGIERLPVIEEVPGAASLWTCFMCSMRASLPRNNLWQSEQQVVLGPPIRAACCFGKTKRANHQPRNRIEGALEQITGKRATGKWGKKNRLGLLRPLN